MKAALLRILEFLAGAVVMVILALMFAESFIRNS